MASGSAKGGGGATSSPAKGRREISTSGSTFQTSNPNSPNYSPF